MAEKDKLGRYNPGRPKKDIDPEQVRKLAMINCSYEEMAAILKCDESTLTRRFAQVIKEGRANLKTSLKRAMYTKAVTEKNTTMQIWLSKALLGYRDNVDITGDINVEHNVKVSALGPEQLTKMIEKDPFSQAKEVEIEHDREDDQ